MIASILEINYIKTPCMTSLLIINQVTIVLLILAKQTDTNRIL